MRRKRIHGDGCFQFIRWDDESDTEAAALQRHLDSGQCETRAMPKERKQRKPSMTYHEGMKIDFLE